MSILTRLFSKQEDPKDDLRPLWHAVVMEARQPHWYANLGVVDTVPGRFDMLTAVLSQTLIRMESEQELHAPSVFLTELFVDDMDSQLREEGINDPTLGKKVGQIMSVLGGRLGAYREAGDDTQALADVAARNFSLRGRDDSETADLAGGLIALRERLDRTDAKTLLSGAIAP